MTPHNSVRTASLRRGVSAVGILSAVLLGLILIYLEPLASLGNRPRGTPSSWRIHAGGQFSNLTKGDATIQLQEQLLSTDRRSRRALELFTSLLEDARQRLEKTADYTASYVMQERIDDQELQELQHIELKVRHVPFSVYMKWVEGGDLGREVLYVTDQLDNSILLHPGGIQGQLLRSLKLNPTGSLAMKESRYPATDMGLHNLALKIINLRRLDLAREKGVQWQLLSNESCFDRECLCLLVEYESPEVNATFRKSLTYIDKESSLPVCVKSFAWADASSKLKGEQLDDATLVEFYGYKNVQFNIGLSDHDFDKENPEYAFSK